MFEPLKAKLASIEVKLRACVTSVNAGIAQVEAAVNGLDVSITTPLDVTMTSVARVEADARKQLAPLSARVTALKPPKVSG